MFELLIVQFGLKIPFSEFVDVVACWGGRKVIISPHHYKMTLCDLMTTLLSPIKEKKVDDNILAIEASAGNSH